MLFDKFKKRKKYPDNRKQPGPARLVYAGPEQLRRGRPEDDAPRKVYAGPERGRAGREAFETVYGGPPPVPEDPPAPVYAGPREDSPLDVYAGPAPDAPAKPVYAGPEELLQDWPL